MEIKSEHTDFQNKIMEGVSKAVKKLITESAELNEKLVVSYEDGNVQHVPAKELLKSYSK